ncbi:hypothetical protein BDV19DRAFT_213412 [Aspergillus venezuelensis]
MQMVILDLTREVMGPLNSMRGEGRTQNIGVCMGVHRLETSARLVIVKRELCATASRCGARVIHASQRSDIGGRNIGMLRDSTYENENHNKSRSQCIHSQGSTGEDRKRNRLTRSKWSWHVTQLHCQPRWTWITQLGQSYSALLFQSIYISLDVIYHFRRIHDICQKA